jgi:hypothetical protein
VDFWFPNAATDLNNRAQYEEDNQQDFNDLTCQGEQVLGFAPVSRYNIGVRFGNIRDKADVRMKYLCTCKK